MIGLSALHFYLIYTCCFEALLPIVEAPLFFAFNRRHCHYRSQHFLIGVIR